MGYSSISRNMKCLERCIFLSFNSLSITLVLYILDVVRAERKVSWDDEDDTLAGMGRNDRGLQGTSFVTDSALLEMNTPPTITCKWVFFVPNKVK